MKLYRWKEENIRTDLACERRRADTDLPGVSYREEGGDPFPVSRLCITERAGAEAIGRPCGTYLTLTCPPLFAVAPEDEEAGAAQLSELIGSLLPERGGCLLVVGLGNGNLTPDAVGPRVTERIPASAHELAGGICLLTPGVTEMSGVEAARAVRGWVREIRPRAVIAVDALCARSTERLARTVQITDTGIVPGGGIRNARTPLTREEMGCPVIAVGVPTIVSSAALVCDALEAAGAEDIPESFRRLIAQEDDFVVPKDIDAAVCGAADLIAGAIERLAR